MKKFEGILIATDLDDTLLNSQGKVSEENRAAIEYFKSEGGLFTFSTARALFNTKKVSDVVAPNAPIVFLNGGGVYDYVKKELIWAHEIDPIAVGMADFVKERVDGFAVVYASFDSAYCEEESAAVVRYATKRGIALIKGKRSEMTCPLCKVIFVADDDEPIIRVVETLKQHPEYDRFNYKRIEEGVYQIFPKGLSKGDAFERMVEAIGIDKRRTVTVGDHAIDIPMFEKAAVGVAVANGTKEAKAAADVVTVSNDEHAIKRIIEDIESGAIRL